MKNQKKHTRNKLLSTLICSLLLLISYDLLAMDLTDGDPSEGKEKSSVPQIPYPTDCQEPSQSRSRKSSHDPDAGQRKVLRRKSIKIKHLDLSASSSPKSRGSSSPNQGPESSPKFPNEEEVEERRRYMNYVTLLLGRDQKTDEKTDEERALIVAHSFSLFIDQKTLFSHLIPLKETNPDKVKIFLEKFFLEGVPYDVSAKNELRQLKNGFDIPLIDLYLNGKLLNNDGLKSNEVSKLVIQQGLSKTPNIDWNERNIQLFKMQLVVKSIKLFKNISIEDFKNYLKSQKNLPQSITDLSTAFDQGVNYIAYQIIFSDKKEKDSLFKKFYTMGCQLVTEEGNLHAAMQVASALSKTVVEQLISPKVSGFEDFKGSIDFFAFASPGRNYKEYREWLDKSKSKPYFMGALPVICFDLLKIYDTYNSRNLEGTPQEIVNKVLKGYPQASPKTLQILQDLKQSLENDQLDPRISTLEHMAKTLKIVSSIRSLPYPDMPAEAPKFIYGFDISDGLLEVASDMQKNNSISLKNWKAFPALNEWTILHLGAVLKATGSDVSFFQNLYEGKPLQNGKDIISYMGSGAKEQKKAKLRELGIQKKTAKMILKAYEAVSADHHSQATGVISFEQSDTVLETDAPPQQEISPAHQPDNLDPSFFLG